MKKREKGYILNIFVDKKHPGVLTFDNEQISFKSNEEVAQVKAKDLMNAELVQTDKNSFQLKVQQKGGKFVMFDGFLESDLAKLEELLKSLYKIKAEKVELATRGWNWVKSIVNGDTLEFHQEKKRAFFLPMNDIERSTINKDEVTVTLHEPTVKGAKNLDILLELKFAIPASTKELKEEEEEEEGEEEREEGERKEKDPKSLPSAAEDFHRAIMEGAGIDASIGEGIASFKGIKAILPRGRFEIALYPNFVKFEGKSYNYKIAYKTISKVYQLPKPGDQIVYFVVTSSFPIFSISENQKK